MYMYSNAISLADTLALFNKYIVLNDNNQVRTSSRKTCKPAILACILVGFVVRFFVASVFVARQIIENKQLLKI